uniref:BHLH92b n=1 Tax=Leymus chinensis TaxID=52714 RepID=A0A3Q8BXD6_LEYCH|nr:bHLH92b [Leymus chinensis]ATQ36625.1 bHLH92b [Leymus chinensis]
MQMDSYYFHDDAHFFAGGVPGSPDLPFADLIASLSEPLPTAPSQSAFHEYRGVGLGLPGTMRGGGTGVGNKSNIHRRMMDVLGRMGPTAGGSCEEEGQEERLTTEMNVETTIAACEVEKAVEEALQEVERNQLPDSEAPFPGSRSSWPQTSHVQNVF